MTLRHVKYGLALVTCSLLVLTLGRANAAGNKDNKLSIQLAESLAKRALQAEVAGDAAERERLLAEALRLAPDCESARWQLGELRYGNQWRKVEDIPQLVQSDRRLKAYQRRRDELVNTADNQRELARWCEKSRLPAQARVHWAQVLQFEPQNAEALAKAGGDRSGGNEASRREQIAEAKRRAAEDSKNLQTWRPRLEAWREAFKGGLDGANQAVEEISKIDDPSAAPALLMALRDRNYQEPRLRAAVYQGLGNLRLPEVTQFFVNQAMYGGDSEREMAIAQLKQRPMHVYVPQLLAALPPDLKTKFQIYVLPSGGVLHEHEVAVKTQDADYSYKYENFVQPADFAAAQRSTPQALEREVNRAAMIENEAQRVEVRAQDLRNRIRDVLERTTELELGDDVLDWQRQYEDHYAMYTPESERAYYSQTFSNSEAPFTTPVTTTTSTRLSEPLPRECFVRGTPVLTDLGPKAIETLQAGDRVLAQDVQSGELKYQPILETTIRPPTAIVEIRCDGGEPIAAAAGHPFWVVGTGWQIARFLQPGDRLHTLHGAVTIDSVQAKPAVEAYNLVVDELHTYFVGEGRVLVHDNAPLSEQPQFVPGL